MNSDRFPSGRPPSPDKHHWSEDGLANTPERPDRLTNLLFHGKNPDLMQKSNRTALILIPIFFFLSGMTGLVYEIIWTRMLVKIIGGAPFAVSIVLTVFMGGMGLGSFLASRSTDRIAGPKSIVKIYGILELIIGAFALLVPGIISAIRPLQALLYNNMFDNAAPYHLLTFLFCVVVLSVPAICMGATLPLLCRFYVLNLDHLGAQAGRLYGLNTIGAALGALLCGFWAINILGIQGTVLAAAGVNGMIGLACLLLSGGKGKRRARVRSTGEYIKVFSKDRTSTRGTPEPSSFERRAALVIFAVTGFCSMAYEVILTKLLGLIVGPTTYSFTIVLVVFIFGLALGSIIFGRLADKTAAPFKLLIWTQMGAAFFILGASQLLGNSQLFFAKLIYVFQDHFALLSLTKALALFVFLIIPTLFLGASFPLVGKIFTRSFSRVGRSIGFAYSINTVGAVLGSFCAGFLLIPLMGKENSLRLVIATQLLTSLAAGFILLAKRRQKHKPIFLAVPAVLGFILCFLYPSWNQDLLAGSKYHRLSYFESSIRNTGWLDSLFRGNDILSSYEQSEHVHYGEDVGGFTAISRTSDAFGNIMYSMAISGKTDASSRKDMKTQTLLTHFPMLFHPSAKSVMVVGLASGITAGEVLHYPIERLDILEINRQVVIASDYFNEWNNHVLDHPKTHLILQDARAHLQLTRRKYDVIISEPSNPWMAGLAVLFTSENFARARDRLKENGIFVQWFHAYDMDWETFALVGRTFARVFPNSLLVSTHLFPFGNDYLLVGIKNDSALDLETARRNLAHVRKSTNVTITDPSLLYRLIVSEDMPAFFGPGPINTDDRPRLEFSAPRLMDSSDKQIIENIQSRRRLRPETQRIVRSVSGQVSRQIEFARYSLSLFAPFPSMVDLSKATPAEKDTYFSLLENYCSNNPLDFSYLADDQLIQRCVSVQIASLESKIERMPDKEDTLLYLANLYHAGGRLDEAIRTYKRFLRIKPDNPRVHFNLGIVLIKQQQYPEAAAVLEHALRIKPDFFEARRRLGFALAAQGKIDLASREYSIAIQDHPDDYNLHNDLGILLFQQRKYREAIQHFETALRLNPGFSEARKNLEIAKETKRN